MSTNFLSITNTWSMSADCSVHHKLLKHVSQPLCPSQTPEACRPTILSITNSWSMSTNHSVHHKPLKHVSKPFCPSQTPDVSKPICPSQTLEHVSQPFCPSQTPEACWPTILSIKNSWSMLANHSVPSQTPEACQPVFMREYKTTEASWPTVLLITNSSSMQSSVLWLSNFWNVLTICYAYDKWQSPEIWKAGKKSTRYRKPGVSLQTKKCQPGMSLGRSAFTSWAKPDLVCLNSLYSQAEQSQTWYVCGQVCNHKLSKARPGMSVFTSWAKPELVCLWGGLSPQIEHAKPGTFVVSSIFSN